MSDPQTNPSSGEHLRRISEWSHDAEWTTPELQDALRDSGVDPEQLVQRVLADLQPFLPSQGPEPRPLLVALRDTTQLAPSAIAEAMDVPVTFLSILSRHPDAVPTSWRQEIANRAERGLQVNPAVVLEAFTVPFQYERAASRDLPYTSHAVETVADLLERSGLPPQAQSFWRSLAMRT